MDAVAIFIVGWALGLVSSVCLVRYGLKLAYRIERDVKDQVTPLEDDPDLEDQQTHTGFVEPLTE